MKWIKNKIIGALIATSNIEKNIFTQEKKSLTDDLGQHSEKETGTLMHSLKNNIMTQEVKDLRHRMYKILRHSNNLTAVITGYEPDGTPIVKSTKTDKSKIKKVKVDTFDSYPLEMVIPNDDISITMAQSLDKDLDENNVIEGETFYATNKSNKPILIHSEETRNIFIEKYTKRLNVRGISETEKLLEFYISKYPDPTNKTSVVVLSEIKKIIENKKKSSMLEINNVDFITDKAIGVDNFLAYSYEIISFDKIVEFDGNYVIKFKAKVLIDGEYIFSKYIQEELDLKYQNKEKK